MKRINRLLKNEEFKNVIDQKKKIYNKSFSIYYSKNDLGRARVGISVSKRNGIAVVRNKIKRQAREIVHDVVPIDLGIDFVVVLNIAFVNFSYEENKNNFIDLFNRIVKKEMQKYEEK